MCLYLMGIICILYLLRRHGKQDALVDSRYKYLICRLELGAKTNSCTTQSCLNLIDSSSF
jgi:hypothetical protein